MNTLEIDYYANSNATVRKIFGGCFASNKIPQRRIRKFPYAIVINTCKAGISSAALCH